MVFTLRLVEYFYPPKCIFCGEIVEAGNNKYSCGECERFLRPYISTGLMRPTDKFEKLVCLWKYEGMVKESLKKYKFNDKAGYYRAFSIGLYEKLKQAGLEKIDGVLSVPLHKSRKTERGYNQSFLISRMLSGKMKVPEMSRLLIRVRNTESQSLLSQKGRSENMKGAFRVSNPFKIRGKNILLVDDVVTTGNTLNECTKMLKDAGAGKIYAAVVASARER